MCASDDGVMNPHVGFRNIRATPRGHIGKSMVGLSFVRPVVPLRSGHTSIHHHPSRWRAAACADRKGWRPGPVMRSVTLQAALCPPDSFAPVPRIVSLFASGSPWLLARIPLALAVWAIMERLYWARAAPRRRRGSITLSMLLYYAVTCLPWAVASHLWRSLRQPHLALLTDIGFYLACAYSLGQRPDLVNNSSPLYAWSRTPTSPLTRPSTSLLLRTVTCYWSYILRVYGVLYVLARMLGLGLPAAGSLVALTRALPRVLYTPIIPRLIMWIYALYFLVIYLPFTPLLQPPQRAEPVRLNMMLSSPHASPMLLLMQRGTAHTTEDNTHAHRGPLARVVQALFFPTKPIPRLRDRLPLLKGYGASPEEDMSAIMDADMDPRFHSRRSKPRAPGHRHRQEGYMMRVSAWILRRLRRRGAERASPDPIADVLAAIIRRNEHDESRDKLNPTSIARAVEEHRRKVAAAAANERDDRHRLGTAGGYKEEEVERKATSSVEALHLRLAELRKESMLAQHGQNDTDTAAAAGGPRAAPEELEMMACLGIIDLRVADLQWLDQALSGSFDDVVHSWVVRYWLRADESWNRRQAAERARKKREAEAKQAVTEFFAAKAGHVPTKEAADAEEQMGEFFDDDDEETDHDEESDHDDDYDDEGVEYDSAYASEDEGSGGLDSYKYVRPPADGPSVRGAEVVGSDGLGGLDDPLRLEGLMMRDDDGDEDDDEDGVIMGDAGVDSDSEADSGGAQDGDAMQSSVDSLEQALLRERPLNTTEEGEDETGGGTVRGGSWGGGRKSDVVIRSDVGSRVSGEGDAVVQKASGLPGFKGVTAEQREEDEDDAQWQEEEEGEEGDNDGDEDDVEPSDDEGEDNEEWAERMRVRFLDGSGSGGGGGERPIADIAELAEVLDQRGQAQALADLLGLDDAEELLNLRKRGTSRGGVSATVTPRPADPNTRYYFDAGTIVSGPRDESEPQQRGRQSPSSSSRPDAAVMRPPMSNIDLFEPLPLYGGRVGAAGKNALLRHFLPRYVRGIAYTKVLTELRAEHADAIAAKQLPLEYISVVLEEVLSDALRNQSLTFAEALCLLGSGSADQVSASRGADSNTTVTSEGSPGVEATAMLEHQQPPSSTWPFTLPPSANVTISIAQHTGPSVTVPASALLNSTNPWSTILNHTTVLLPLTDGSDTPATTSPPSPSLHITTSHHTLTDTLTIPLRAVRMFATPTDPVSVMVNKTDVKAAWYRSIEWDAPPNFFANFSSSSVSGQPLPVTPDSQRSRDLLVETEAEEKSVKAMRGEIGRMMWVWEWYKRRRPELALRVERAKSKMERLMVLQSDAEMAGEGWVVESADDEGEGEEAIDCGRQGQLRLLMGREGVDLSADGLKKRTWNEGEWKSSRWMREDAASDKQGVVGLWQKIVLRRRLQESIRGRSSTEMPRPPPPPIL